jgi:hypothetical protein
MTSLIDALGFADDGSDLAEFLKGSKNDARAADYNRIMAKYAESVDFFHIGSPQELARKKEVRDFLRKTRFGLNDKRLANLGKDRVRTLRELQARAKVMDQQGQAPPPPPPQEEKKQVVQNVQPIIEEEDEAQGVPDEKKDDDVDEEEPENKETSYITPKILGIKHQTTAGRFVNATVYGKKGSQKITTTADQPGYDLIVERYKDSVRNANKGTEEEKEQRRLIRGFLMRPDYGLENAKFLPKNISTTLLALQVIALPMQEQEQEQEPVPVPVSQGVMTEAEMKARTDQEYPEGMTWTDDAATALQAYQYTRLSLPMKNALVDHLTEDAISQGSWVNTLKAQLKDDNATDFELHDIDFQVWLPLTDALRKMWQDDFVDEFGYSLYKKLVDAKDTYLRIEGEKAKKQVAAEWYHLGRILTGDEVVNMRSKEFKYLDVGDKTNVANSIIQLGKDVSSEVYWKDQIIKKYPNPYPLPSIATWIGAQKSTLATWIQESDISKQITEEETKWFNTLYTQVQNETALVPVPAPSVPIEEKKQDKGSGGGGGITGYLGSFIPGRKSSTKVPVPVPAPSPIPQQGISVIELEGDGDSQLERIARNRQQKNKNPETEKKTPEPTPVIVLQESKDVPPPPIQQTYGDILASAARSALDKSRSTISYLAGSNNTKKETKGGRRIRKARVTPNGGGGGGMNVMDDMICLSGMMGLIHGS